MSQNNLSGTRKPGAYENMNNHSSFPAKGTPKNPVTGVSGKGSMKKDIP